MPRELRKRCELCGERFTASPLTAKSTKFCKICQVVRDASTYRGYLEHPKECVECSRIFWPIRQSRHWTRCGYCRISRLSDSVKCHLCGDWAVPAEGLEATCVGCVQSTADLRNQYIDRCRSITEERRKKLFAELNAKVEKV